jgi:hypothetical protein
MIHNISTLTRVADMPGYPTRKLLFGGPETRTKAAIRSVMLELPAQGSGMMVVVWAVKEVDVTVRTQSRLKLQHVFVSPAEGVGAGSRTGG